jgi:hypothetical protein
VQSSDLNYSKLNPGALKVTKLPSQIPQITINEENRISAAEAATSIHPNVSAARPLFSAERAGEVWEPFKKIMLPPVHNNDKVHFCTLVLRRPCVRRHFCDIKSREKADIVTL